MDTGAKTGAHDEAIETLRHAAAAALTRKGFGKALQAFRKATTGLSIRSFAELLLMESSTVSDKENGKSAFEEWQLRNYMGACPAVDDDLISFCWEHCQRTKDLTDAPSDGSEQSQSTNTKIDLLLRAFVTGKLFTLAILMGLVVASISSSAPVGASERSAMPPAAPVDVRMWVSEIRNYLGPLCMRSIEGDTERGTSLIMLKCPNLIRNKEDIVNPETWLFASFGPAYLIEKFTDMCVKAIDGTGVFQDQCISDDSNDKVEDSLWWITPLERRDDGWLLVTFHSYSNRQRCLTIPGKSYILGISLILAPCANSDNQKFWINGNLHE
ncbi:MAG: hypothetical protein JO281_02515 [Pseudonocardiales bacterium]|nr:hypothetical protein [Pseudonocardiales bacterium]